MTRIAINFYDAPLWLRYRWGLWLLAIGVATCGLSAWYGWQAFSELTRWNAELAKFRQVPTTERTLAEGASVRIDTELESANEVIVRLNTPWAELFSALETVYNDDAVLLSVDPDSVSRQVRLSAESRNTESMLTFVRQLRESKVLADAYVVNHIVNQQDMQRPIRFSVAAHWLDLPSVAENVTPEESKVAEREGEPKVTTVSDVKTDTAAAAEGSKP